VIERDFRDGHDGPNIHAHNIINYAMEVHRELGNGFQEVI